MRRTGSHFAKDVTIGRRDWKISALNIGTNHYANMPANQGGGAGQISTGAWAKTAAPLRVKNRRIRQGGYPRSVGTPANFEINSENASEN